MNCKMMKKFTFFSLILLLLSSVPASVYAQAGNASPLTVRGIVTDESGAPISGVTVTAPNSGDVTNNLGEYSITVPADGELTFSFMGYTTQTLPVNNRSQINVTLDQESHVLDDVIVIGYGTTTRRRAVGAVDQVKASQISNRSVANLTQALQGTSPALTIQNRSFDPNGQSMNINIRGIGTMNSNSPLFVIDGLVSDGSAFNRLNPADIESVSVLKDASTAAIYGSRGANGVLLVTTKKGSKDQPMSVSFTARLGVQSPKILFTPVEGYQNATLNNVALANAGMTLAFTQAQINDLYENGSGPFFLNEILQNALQQNYNVNVSGGSGSTTYMISGGYFNQRSNYVGPDYGVENINLRSNITTEYKRFKLTSLMSYARNNSKNSSHPDIGFILADAARAPLYYYNQLKDSETGRYIGNNFITANPLGSLEAGGFNENKNDYFNFNFGGEFKVIDGLKIRGVIGADIFNNFRYTRRFPVSYYNINDIMGKATYIDNVDRDSENESSKSWVTNMQLMADFDRYFGKHHVYALVGGSNESYTRYGHKVRIKKSDPDLGTKGSEYEFDAGGTDVSPNNTEKWSLSSVFGRVGYDYDNKYFIEASFRYDGSSRFQKDLRWGFFPSVTVGWRASEENFMEWWKYNMGELKLRASYGTLGNQDVSLYQYYTTYEILSNTYAFDNVLTGGTAFKVGSDNLQWEVTRTFNVGADLSFFKNSLNVSFDYFVRNTSEILVAPLFPLLYGTAPQDYNNGGMRTQGWELTVGYNLSAGKTFHSFNLSFGDSWNVVTKFEGYESWNQHEEIWKITRVGLPFASYYGYKSDGMFQSDEEAASWAQFSGNQFQAGDLRIVDRNGDGVLNSNDWHYLGNAFPRYTFGFNYTFNWKWLDFNLFLQGVMKRDMMVRGELIEPFHENYGYTMYKHQLDYWTPTNTDATWPRLAKNNTLNYGKGFGSDLFVFSGAYLRVKNIQIGFTLPQEWSEKAGMSKLRLYVNAQNPLTLAATSFIDPESSEFGNNMNSGGANSARNYPTLRYWGGGLEITF